MRDMREALCAFAEARRGGVGNVLVTRYLRSYVAADTREPGLMAAQAHVREGSRYVRVVFQ